MGRAVSASSYVTDRYMLHGGAVWSHMAKAAPVVYPHATGGPFKPCTSHHDKSKIASAVLAVASTASASSASFSSVSSDAAARSFLGEGQG